LLTFSCVVTVVLIVESSDSDNALSYDTFKSYVQEEFRKRIFKPLKR